MDYGRQKNAIAGISSKQYLSCNSRDQEKAVLQRKNDWMWTHRQEQDEQDTRTQTVVTSNSEAEIKKVTAQILGHTLMTK
jgi:hypothetical protein